MFIECPPRNSSRPQVCNSSGKNVIKICISKPKSNKTNIYAEKVQWKGKRLI